MHSSQLTLSVIMVSLLACASDPQNNANGFGPGEQSTGTGLAGSGGRGSTGSGGNEVNASDSGHPSDASTTVGAGGGAGSIPVSDAASDRGVVVKPDGPPAMMMHGEAGVAACSNDRASLNSSELRAGASTPAAFADAFNAEMKKLTTPGPLLILLRGVNDGSLAPKIASFGALKPLSLGVGFDGASADVPFTIGAGRSVQIPAISIAFQLKFVAPANDAVLPVSSVELAGKLASACSSLNISSMKLLVPASASSIAFHGSTVGALMGAPTASILGGSNNAWPLELSGVANEVLALIAEDAGAGSK
jgi:hypothetical protein